MNERIKELAEQASTHAEETVHYYMGQFDGLTWEAKILKERDLKFAELIVQKCADIGEQYADGNYEVRNQILEYFGLEEE